LPAPSKPRLTSSWPVTSSTSANTSTRRSRVSSSSPLPPSSHPGKPP